MSSDLDTSVVVLLNGIPFDGWLAIQVTQTFDQASGDGTIRMSPQPGVPLPIKLGDKAQILCAGEPVITGHVHRVWGEHDLASHVIQAQIRDNTQDAIDSTIGPKVDIDPPVALPDVMKKTLGTMGLDHIGVIDKVGAEPFKQGEKVSGAIDDYGHEFMEQWARKRDAVLTTDGKGNYVIDRNQGERLGAAFIHFGLPDDPLNNCEKSQFGIEDFQRHNGVAVAGQKSPNDKQFWESRGKDEPLGQAAQMSSRYGVASDPSVRKERKRHIRGGRGHQGKSPRESAKWRANSMRAKSNEYVCTVTGFRAPGGALWWPGKIVPVYDYWWSLSADLFLKEVSFTKDWGKGACCSLKFSIEDAFKDQAGATGGSGRTSSGLPGDPGEVHGSSSAADMGIDDDMTEVEEEP